MSASTTSVPRARNALPWTLKRSLPILLCVLLVMLYAGSRFTIAINDQVHKCLPPYRVFLVDGHDDRIERGRIVAFRAGIRMKPWFPEDFMVIKRIVGIPGDRIVVGARETTVNGERVGEGLDLAATLGRSETAFERELILGEGQLWIMGDTRDSFDARYWGALATHQIIGRSYAIW